MFETIIEKLGGLGFNGSSGKEPDYDLGDSIKAKNMATYALLKCLFELEAEGRMDMERFEEILGTDLVAAAKGMNERAVSEPDYEVTEGETIEHDREFGWVRYLNRVVMIYHQLPPDELPEDDFTVPEKLFSRDYEEATLELANRLYVAFLHFSGYEQDELPFPLLACTVEHAEENDMIKGHRFSSWFPRARADLDQEIFNKAMGNKVCYEQ